MSFKITRKYVEVSCGKDGNDRLPILAFRYDPSNSMIWGDQSKEGYIQDQEVALTPESLSSSSSLASSLCRVFTITYLKPTMFLGYAMLELFCIYSLCYM